MSRQTTEEKKGDIILGTHLILCCYETHFNKAGNLQRSRGPLVKTNKFGLQDHGWTKHETRPGGWKRDVHMVLKVDAMDPTRATARFEVISVKDVPAEAGRDEGYGGGTMITVRRLDGKQERIRYTRGCCFNTDCTEPAVVI